MYEFITNINKNEYEEFIYNHSRRHFMHSYAWGEVQKLKKFKAHYVGLKKDNILVATALLLEKKVLKKYGYIYIPRGFVLDYNDKDILNYFTNEIKNFCKKTNNFFFRIDPDIKLQNIDEQANPIEGENNYQLIDNLKKLSYKHKGFNKNFESSQPRYTYRLALSKELEEVYKGFHATTRKVLNKNNQYDLDIYKGNESDIKDFYITMKETAKREGIIQAPIQYYEKFYTILNESNMSDIYIVKVNIKKLIEKYNLKVNQIKEDINKIKEQSQSNEKKSKNTINDLTNQLNKMTQEINELKEINEETLILSSIITVKYNDYVWTVHGGNNSKLRWLNANYLIYYEIIKDAVESNSTMIDFFGTTGNPSPDNSVYGIHLFKKRLGGEYTEFIGEFDYITNKLLYVLYNLYIKIKRGKK